MFGVLHNKVSGGDFYTDMNNYIKLEGSTGANNCQTFGGNFKIPLYDGKTMPILSFSSSISKEFSKIFPRGMSYYDDKTYNMTQHFDSYNGHITQLQKITIKFNTRNNDLFESNYRK